MNFENISVVVIDEDSDKQKDIWHGRIRIGVRKGSITESFLNNQDWKEMIENKKTVQFDLDISNSLSDLNFSQLSITNLKFININDFEISIYLSDTSLVHSKTRNKISDVYVYVKGSVVMDKKPGGFPI